MGSVSGGLASSLVTTPFISPEISGFATAGGTLLSLHSVSDLSLTIPMLKGIGMGAGAVGLGAAVGTVLGSIRGTHEGALNGMVGVAILVNCIAPIFIVYHLGLADDPLDMGESLSLRLTIPFSATLCTFIFTQSLPIGGFQASLGSELGNRVGETSLIRKISGGIAGGVNVAGEVIHYL